MKRTVGCAVTGAAPVPLEKSCGVSFIFCYAQRRSSRAGRARRARTVAWNCLLGSTGVEERICEAPTINLLLRRQADNAPGLATTEQLGTARRNRRVGKAPLENILDGLPPTFTVMPNAAVQGRRREAAASPGTACWATTTLARTSHLVSYRDNNLG